MNVDTNDSYKYDNVIVPIKFTYVNENKKQQTNITNIFRKGNVSNDFNIYIHIPKEYEGTELKPKEIIKIPLGICIEIDEFFVDNPVQWGIFILIQSINENKVKIPFGNNGGVIDSDYRNELMLILYNSSDYEKIKLTTKQPYAKINIVKYFNIEFISNEVEFQLKSHNWEDEGRKLPIYYQSNDDKNSPEQGTPNSAGYDIYTKINNLTFKEDKKGKGKQKNYIQYYENNIKLEPNNVEEFKTNSVLKLLPGIKLFCHPRSNVGAKKKIIVLGEEYDHTNGLFNIEFRASCFNGIHTKNDLIDESNLGILRNNERHIQMVFVPENEEDRYFRFTDTIFIQKNQLSKTKRNGGFGSTGFN